MKTLWTEAERTEWKRKFVAQLNIPPFGFTREDVAVLREAAWAFGSMHSEVDQSAAELRVASIADRLEALLPPEST